MPHDAKGNVLKPGDRIVIPATVLVVHPGQDYCNCDVEFEYPMPPNAARSRFSTLNTRQVEKVAEAETAK